MNPSPACVAATVVDFPIEVFPENAIDCCDECWQPCPGPRCVRCDDQRLAVTPAQVRQILRAAGVPTRQLLLVRPAGHCNPCHITVPAPGPAQALLCACRTALLQVGGIAVATGQSSLDGMLYLRVRRDLVGLIPDAGA